MWLDKSDDKEYIKNMLPDCEDLTVVGIIRQAPDAVNASISGYIGYLTDLESYVIDKVNNSEIVKEQQDNPDVNVFTGLKFEDGENGFDMSTLTPEQQQMLANMTPEQLSEIVATYTENANATYDGNLKKMGYVDVESPSSINLYPKDFESKESLTDLIDDYNTKAKNEDREEDVIVYTDMMAILISSVTNIVDIVSYVLIAFVSISLVVSSIMIGIITYISVLERTKEIGILRAIGASKKDIARVFNAETLIVGLIAGIIGVVSTVLITIPVNIIIKDLTDVSNLAQLPIVASLILIAISVFLTMFAGLIPSRVASKKDPVVALRTE